MRDIVISQFLLTEMSTYNTQLSQHPHQYHHYTSFLNRFKEYARFGKGQEPQKPGISMLNCDK